MKNQLKIKAVIFDMDGVIVDTMPLLYKAWSELMQDEFGIKFSRKFFYEEISGRRAPEAIEYILKEKPDKNFLKDFNK
ncbi:HAD family phosphatase, partial [Patescibacteria group bacterium]|nr:HAD family phosphatase [Patescibacteria group bacterium]